MGLDYNLELAVEMVPEQVLHLLARHLGFPLEAESQLNGPGLWIRVGETRKARRALIEEAFQFSPNVSVQFRLGPADVDYDEGCRSMLRAVLFLLEVDAARDGVLFFNWEIIVLQRLKKAGLILNSNYVKGTWLEDEFHVNQTPHEECPLPPPWP
jgi:hypothetical protein